MKENKKRLGDLLVDSGRLKEEDLAAALKIQATTGKRLGQILVEKRLITEDDILTILEMQMGIPRIHLDFTPVEESAVYRISEALAKKHTVIPIKVKDNKIILVTSDPFNILAIEDIKIATGLDVELVLDSSEDISEAIKRYYSRQVAERTAKNLADREAREKKEENDVDFDEVKDAPAVKLVDSIIENAVRMKASDVHIEPLEKKVRVRFRVDGNLQKVLEISKETQGSLITRIKIVANLNIAEKRVPQDGRIITNIDNKEVDLRVSVLPTIHGEKIVIRILLRSSFLMKKEELGLSNYNMKILSSIMDKPYGIILVTGPTGSGKSTTVYTLLNELNTIDKNIITVEDPVEYIVEGISQVNVNAKAGLTFASGLRSMLRQDPDIIMIGEIRDNETAEIAIRAAITGHIVLSTIHTNDAPSTIARLKDMNIEPYLISTSINGIIAQRLVRKVCPHCYEIYEASDYEKEILEVDNDISLSLARAKGCPLCQDIGYKGRIGIYEIMDIGRELREGINKKKNSDELRDIAIKSGMKTLKMACKEHVINKITTVDELLRVTFLKE